MEACVNVICRKIELYDFEGFADEFLIRYVYLREVVEIDNRALLIILLPFD